MMLDLVFVISCRNEQWESFVLYKNVLLYNISRRDTCSREKSFLFSATNVFILEIIMHHFNAAITVSDFEFASRYHNTNSNYMHIQKTIEMKLFNKPKRWMFSHWSNQMKLVFLLWRVALNDYDKTKWNRTKWSTCA